MDSLAPFPEKLDLRAYFVGRCQAWGMVMNRAGKVERRFRVEIVGHLQDEALLLDESFIFDDGETDHRVWQIKHRGHTVSGSAADVIGHAGGEITGPFLQWSYDVALTVRKRKVRVRFDDWMTLADDNVMLSRAVIRKFGFRVGDVFIAFKKLEEPASPPAA
ncbi:MAG: DUF3833 family protein [Alphaproteobacteria bacterium]|jgi:hypothetical protein